MSTEIEQIAIKSQNVLCGYQNKFIKAYIIIKNEKFDKIIEDKPKNNGLIQEFIIKRKLKIIDYNQLFILPGIIDSNCQLFSINQAQNCNYISDLTLAATTQGVTTIINSPITFQQQNPLDLKSLILELKIHSKCDFGQIGLLEKNQIDKTISQCDQLLGTKLYFSTAELQDEYCFKEPNEILKALQKLADFASNLPVLFQASKYLEKDIGITSPYRKLPHQKRLQQEDLSLNFYQSQDGVQGEKHQKLTLSQQFQDQLTLKEIDYIKKFFPFSQQILELHLQWISQAEEMSYERIQDLEEKKEEISNELEILKLIQDDTQKLLNDNPQFKVEYENLELNQLMQERIRFDDEPLQSSLKLKDEINDVQPIGPMGESYTNNMNEIFISNSQNDYFLLQDTITTPNPSKINNYTYIEEKEDQDKINLDFSNKNIINISLRTSHQSKIQILGGDNDIPSESDENLEIDQDNVQLAPIRSKKISEIREKKLSLSPLKLQKGSSASIRQRNFSSISQQKSKRLSNFSKDMSYL